MMNRDRTESGPASEHPKPQAESQKDIEILIGKLEEGSLAQDEQSRLGDLLKTAPSSVVMTATRHHTFIGPVPPPEQLNRYDEKTRDIILDMARNEQRHAHELRERGLNGAIAKDKRGQWLGAGIAITGLLVAAFVAPYSAVAAAIIGSLDLFGMVALFVAPRVLENRKRVSGEKANTDV
ncbi:MAG: DUF2335 domain-containing protein [Deltaproteobacteria bacterium]|nr:DUF2335 domain-containing protein [Deltaproteobacteria bacterium]